MPGTKKLSVPNISANYKWNAPEVLSLCSQGALYIMANRLPLSWPNGDDVSIDEESLLLSILVSCCYEGGSRLKCLREFIRKKYW